MDDTRPPKIKRFLVIACLKKQTFAALYINSSLNQNLPQMIRDLNIKLDANRFSTILDHDSYLSCSYLAEKDISKLKDEYLKDRNIYLGSFPNDLLSTAIDKIKTATNIAAIDKKKYFLI